MIRLNEYLGSIASNLTEARMISDLKSLEIAEKFSKHELLKHFSIPRFRAQNIELTIPIAIDTMEEKVHKEHKPINTSVFNSLAYSKLKDISKVASFDKQTSKYLKRIISKETKLLEKNLESDSNQEVILEKFTKSLSKKFISYTKKEFSSKDIAKELLSNLRKEINPRVSKTSINTNVIVEAHKLKEIRPENIIQIKMTLAEEGMEWHSMEDKDGNTVNKLLAE